MTGVQTCALPICFYGYLLISFNLGQCPDDATMLADAALHTLVITTDQVQLILISCWAQVCCPMQHTPIFPIPCDYSVSYLSFRLLYSRPAHSIKVHSYSTRIFISIVSFFPFCMPIPLECLISLCFPHFAAHLSAAHPHYLICFTYSYSYPLHVSSIINCHHHPQFPIPMVTFIF